MPPTTEQDHNNEPNDFDHIAERQGWSDGSRLDLMREFIAEHGLNEQLSDYAAEVARRENEPELPTVGTPGEKGPQT